MRFAEKNHKLVYAFLQEQRYDGDYYDLAVMGYLRAVERYCSHAYLRRFSFSTVAYRAMQQSIVSWKRGESRRRTRRRKPTVRFAAAERPSVTRSFRKHISFRSCKKCGTPQQAAFALLRLHGYSIAEIAARYKLDPRRVRRMLKSLYSAYLRVRGDGEGGEKMKDQHTRMLHGRLLRPLKVGSSALIDHEGQFILTSLVTSIQVQNEQEAKFETLNTHYHVKFSPLQAAVAASILMAVAA